MWDECICCREVDVFDALRCLRCQVTCDGPECEVRTKGDEDREGA